MVSCHLLAVNGFVRTLSDVLEVGASIPTEAKLVSRKPEVVTGGSITFRPTLRRLPRVLEMVDIVAADSIGVDFVPVIV